MGASYKPFLSYLSLKKWFWRDGSTISICKGRIISDSWSAEYVKMDENNKEIGGDGESPLGEEKRVKQKEGNDGTVPIITKQVKAKYPRHPVEKAPCRG